MGNKTQVRFIVFERVIDMFTIRRLFTADYIVFVCFPYVLFKWEKEKRDNQLILIAPLTPQRNYYTAIQKKATSIIDLNLTEEDILIPVGETFSACRDRKFHLFACIL